MTEHIINIAVGIDDDAIRKAVIDGAEKKIICDIKEDILKHLFMSKYYSYSAVDRDHRTGAVTVSRDAILNELAMNIVKETIEGCKEDIIDRAAKEIAESYKRSKAFKEKMKGTTE